MLADSRRASRPHVGPVFHWALLNPQAIHTDFLRFPHPPLQVGLVEERGEVFSPRTETLLREKRAHRYRRLRRGRVVRVPLGDHRQSILLALTNDGREGRISTKS